MITYIITAFLILMVALVFYSFLLGEKQTDIRKDITRLSGRRRINCSICGNVYEDTPTDGLTLCPQCNSYTHVQQEE